MDQRFQKDRTYVTDPVEMIIDRLGAKGGDGIALHGGKSLYVPFTLEGEQILATPMGERAELKEVLSPSKDRIDPVCSLYQTCGGCSMQHLAPEPYSAWKRNMVVDALASRGLEETTIKPMITTAVGGRRRAVLTARLMGRRLLFGYHEVARTASLTLINAPPCWSLPYLTCCPNWPAICRFS